MLSPDDNLTAQVVQWLEHSDLPVVVTGEGSTLSHSLALEGAALDLYGDYTSAQPQAVMTIKFFLLNDQDVRPRLLWMRQYSRRVPLAGTEPAALVTAWNKALQAILEDLVRDLRDVQAIQAASQPSAATEPSPP